MDLESGMSTRGEKRGETKRREERRDERRERRERRGVIPVVELVWMYGASALNHLTT